MVRQAPRSASLGFGSAGPRRSELHAGHHGLRPLAVLLRGRTSHAASAGSGLRKNRLGSRRSAATPVPVKNSIRPIVT